MNATALDIVSEHDARPSRIAPRMDNDSVDDAIVAGSPAMRDAMRRIDRVAPLDTTVLLTGESGTGKELIATRLHRGHPTRHLGPLVRVHCGAIPETLLESELFGHTRGAFTGADRDRTGVFEQADGGTLFLDEISTMSPAAQIRLLRVLQERAITRVGSDRSRPVDVRVVVATNLDLRELVDRGDFRLDLYYRVSTFPVELPALRERTFDVAGLTDALSRRIARRLGLGAPKRVGAEVLDLLCTYEWPGNVRELENALEHACILAGPEREIRREHLPQQFAELSGAPASRGSVIRVTEDGISFRTAVTNLERELILQSLQITEGNKARAAELLGLKRTTFLEKLRRYEAEA